MPAVGTSFKMHSCVRIIITFQTELAKGNNFLDSYLLGSKYESTEDSGLLDEEKKHQTIKKKKWWGRGCAKPQKSPEKNHKGNLPVFTLD